MGTPPLPPPGLSGGSSSSRSSISRGRRSALLAVIGPVGSEEERAALRRSLERGIYSWDVDLHSCDLNQQLRNFVTSHLAHFSSEVKGFEKPQE